MRVRSQRWVSRLGRVDPEGLDFAAGSVPKPSSISTVVVLPAPLARAGQRPPPSRPRSSHRAPPRFAIGLRQVTHTYRCHATSISSVVTTYTSAIRPVPDTCASRLSAPNSTPPTGRNCGTSRLAAVGGHHLMLLLTGEDLFGPGRRPSRSRTLQRSMCRDRGRSRLVRFEVVQTFPSPLSHQAPETSCHVSQRYNSGTTWPSPVLDVDCYPSLAVEQSYE